MSREPIGSWSAHRRDYAAKRRFDDVVRAIDKLLDDEAIEHKIGELDRAHYAEARDRAKRSSDHIVAVWD